jgi:hypothetical protein
MDKIRHERKAQLDYYQGAKDCRGMWQAWERKEICVVFWRENLEINSN